MRPATIIDRGRGPEIAGTRITVYDILDYLTDGWHHTRIAALLRLSSDQVLAAARFIEENKDQVMAEYREMLERDARGNTPEIRARNKISRRAVRAELKRIQQREAQEANGARNTGGQQLGGLTDRADGDLNQPSVG